MGLRNRNGKWAWRYELDGREYSETTDLAATGRARTVERNRDKALALMLAHRDAIREGRSPAKKLEARRFSDAASEFLAACDVEHRNHPNTAKRVRVSFASLLPQFGSLMVGQLTPARIGEYKRVRAVEHKVKDVTLRHDLHALSKFFQWAIKMRYAAENPVRATEIPSDADAVRIHVLTADEERAYFAAAAKDQDLYDIARLLLQQGMRPAEAMALTPSAIDLEGGKLRVLFGKTKSAKRTLTLTAESRSIVARRCEGRLPEVRVFSLSPSGLAKKHWRALGADPERKKPNAIGFDFVLYDLRHTFATRMAEAGCDLATLAAILGHAGLRVVQRYVHPTAGHQAKAMAMYERSQIKQEEAVQ